MKLLLKMAGRQFKGISWQHPLTSTIIRGLDPLDYAFRLWRGWDSLPPYSVRVRSNGVRNQFGGERFVREGRILTALLQDKAGVTAASDLLEIGCGCGRLAIPVSGLLEDGSYTGMDIDRPSLQACRNNRLLNRPEFRFQLLDIYNGVYNPGGQLSPATYVFPYDANRFDVVFLFSVFTHILPDGVANYVREIGRMLRTGGRCLFSAFLLDHGHETDNLSFPYKRGKCRVMLEEIPEKAVGYHLAFLDQIFGGAGFERSADVFYGHWRGETASVAPSVEFSQDILVYTKARP